VSGVALALVLGGAVAHAAWNLFFKQATGGVVFTWLCSIAAAALYAPIGLVELARGEASASLAMLAVASGFLHLGYLLVLQRAYAAGDLSHVYPLSRGLGALLAALGAVVALGERPSALASAGIALIVFALLVLAAPGAHRAGATWWALATGVTIAAYTVWDKNAVDDFDRSPLLYFWLNLGTIAIALGLLIGSRRREWRAVWSAERTGVLAFGILGPTAYTLVLLALALSPASHVAPVREVSVVIAAVLGARMLGEESGTRRTLAAAAVAAGIVAVAAG
jgi:drug/metabolite transporter (DMT)-like permease